MRLKVKRDWLWSELALSGLTLAGFHPPHSPFCALPLFLSALLARVLILFVTQIWGENPLLLGNESQRNRGNFLVSYLLDSGGFARTPCFLHV